MRQSRIEDVLEVLKDLKEKYLRSGKSANISRLRKEAIESVAHSELQSGHFKNRNSAERTIHDACTQRLRKIGNIHDFEVAVIEWLNGKPNNIRKALEFEIRSDWERDLISQFFEGASLKKEDASDERKKIEQVPQNESINSSPIASDINEPRSLSDKANLRVLHFFLR